MLANLVVPDRIVIDRDNSEGDGRDIHMLAGHVSKSSSTDRLTEVAGSICRSICDTEV